MYSEKYPNILFKYGIIFQKKRELPASKSLIAQCKPLIWSKVIYTNVTLTLGNAYAFALSAHQTKSNPRN